MFLLLALIVVAVLAWVVTGTARRIALRRAYLAEVDHRSSHERPTPYGGGWGVMAGVLPAWTIIAVVADRPDLFVLLVAAVVLIGVSWIDDRRPLSAGLRLAVQATAVAAAISMLPSDALVFQGWIPFWADRLVVGIGWLWFVNLFNFMDGIDGIAGVETVALGVGLAAVAVIAGPDAGATLPEPMLGLTLAAAAAGFLVWNWHPARIFLGDVGSVPIGFLSAGLLVHLAAAGHLAAALILPAYFLADATVTLVRRGLAREKVWQPHRTHFYQRAARRRGRHDAITLRVAAIDAALVGLAVAAAASGPAALALTAVALLAVALFLWHLDRIARAG